MNMLRILRKRRGWSQKDIADRVGVSRGAVAMWEAGRSSPDADMLLTLAELFGTTVDIILGASYQEHDICKFPIIEKFVSDKSSTSPREISSGDSVEIPTTWLQGLPMEEFLVLSASGLAMWPIIIDRDLLLIRRGDTAASGRIALVAYKEGEAIIRRLEHSPGGGYVDLIPCNPEYAPKRIQGTDLDFFTIYGEVITLIRSMPSI